MRKNTVFDQVLQTLPRYDFEKVCKRHFEGRKRRMDPWTQCVAMLFGQINGCVSLRHIEELLRSHEEKQYHLGIHAVSKSSLARANEVFSYKIYEDLAQLLFERCRKQAPGHGFRFKHRLYSIDATTISLCHELFDWAQFRQSKGGIKIHLQLDHNGNLPCFLHIGEARSHESTKAKLMQLSKGDIAVFDRGYIDYQWFQSLTKQGVFFVTRAKSNMQYKVIERREVIQKSGVQKDQIIQLTGTKSKDLTQTFRRVEYTDGATGETYTYLTNNLRLSAKTIADIYKSRWKIESFFREIKQNLKIKTFIGTSQNAVKTQIYIAICAYLMLKLIAFSTKTKISFGKIRRLLGAILFTTKSLIQLLKPDPLSLTKNNSQLQLLLH